MHCVSGLAVVKTAPRGTIVVVSSSSVNQSINQRTSQSHTRARRSHKPALQQRAAKVAVCSVSSHSSSPASPRVQFAPGAWCVWYVVAARLRSWSWVI